MLAEITVTPIGQAHLAETVAHVVRIVQESGLDHEVTAMGTLVSGDPDAVWALLRQCHDLALVESGRVLTDIRIEGGRELDLEAGPRRVRDVLRAERRSHALSPS